jgi:uncharacterized phage protein gp47/JayE
MTVGVEQLRERLKRSQAIDFLLSQLGALGFNATGWKLDSNQHKFVRAFSTVWSDGSELVRQIADFSLNDYATGTPLRELSRSNYFNTQHEAVKTAGPYKLTNSAATPYTLEVGQLIVETLTGVQFGLTAIPNGPNLPAGGTLVVTISALKAGAAGNVANGSITRFVTALAGVTGTNEAGPGGVPWYTTGGSDEEGVTAIRERNRDRITTLNQISMPAQGYRFIAMSVPGISRVEVDDSNPRGPGTIDVYIATAAGPAGASDILAVQAAIDAKRSPTANVLVLAPTVVNLNPTGFVHIASSFDTAARRQEVIQALTDYVNSLAIGGLKLPPATDGVMPKSELVTAMSQIPGVVAVNLTNPSVDVPLDVFDLLAAGSTSGLTFLSA